MARRASRGTTDPLNVVYRPIADLVPYAQNPRTHSPGQVEAIAASLKEFGWTNPVLIDGKRGIIAGHGRVLAALKLGMTEAPTIELGHLTPAQRRAYVIADNKLAERAEWNLDLLRAEVSAVLSSVNLMSLGFGEGELEALMSPGTSGLTDPEETPAVPENPVSKIGDVWLLGKHRLICGDSTSAEDVAKLMAGRRAQMVFTDPPYGVDYTGGMKRRERLNGDQVGTGIYDAALRHLAAAADDQAPLYLWYADGHAAAAAAAAAGYQIVAQIIWAKNHAQFVTSAHYKGKHEPCYYGHRRGHAARWHGPNNEVTLWEYERSPRNDFHPTQKPVPIAERAIKNSSAPGDAVLDLFLGSGTTLIAAEMTGRICFGLEISPAYVDVIVRRWQDFTGKAARLEDGGATFTQISAERLSPKAAE
jgi:DNA modification methylase